MRTYAELEKLIGIKPEKLEIKKAVECVERQKTHCPKGHPYAGKNLSVYKFIKYNQSGAVERNQRVCLACGRDRYYRYGKPRRQAARKRELEWMK